MTFAFVSLAGPRFSHTCAHGSKLNLFKCGQNLVTALKRRG